MPERYECPVCGYGGLSELPRSDAGGGSFEICPSCGFQFGVSDDDAGWTYESWRAAWVLGGMQWSSVSEVEPGEWNPESQLRAVT